MPSPTVVVVDSDVSALATAADVLRRAGYHVITVGTFWEARDVLARVQPDVLIADVRLGPFNGLHLVLRRHLDRPDSAAIVTNTYPDAVLEGEARRLGAVYLVKPLDPARLLHEIAHLLSVRPAIRPERRRTSRKPLADPVEVVVGQGRGQLVDVSYGGFQLDLASGNAIAVTMPDAFAMIPPGLAVAVRARCVWSRRIPDQDVVRWGAAITEKDSDVLLTWKGYVDQCFA